MPKPKTSTAKVKKVGRDSGTGEFIPVAEATRRPKTTTVETIKPRERAWAVKKVSKKVSKKTTVKTSKPAAPRKRSWSVAKSK